LLQREYEDYNAMNRMITDGRGRRLNSSMMRACHKACDVLAIISLAWLVTLQACKEENEPTPGDTYVTSWILDNMSFIYYWNSRLPSKPDKDQLPDAFYKSLLVAEDRFSQIYDDFEETLSALEGVSKEAGYEIVLYRESGTNSNVIAQVLYIKPGSPASLTALKRGDIVTHINAQQITLDNYRTLLQQLGEDHTLTYRPMIVASSSSGDLGEPVTISLNAVEYQENPNYYTTTFDLGEKKAGYFVYNFFSSGTENGSAYDIEMDQIMADFRMQGITDLVVDLRYNGGGYVSAAVNLASLLGKNIDSNRIFTKREYNSTITSYYSLTEADLITKFVTKAENVGNSLTGNLYILTGPRTASASELVINGLRPFMNVILVGEVTVGKNVGSIPVYEPDNPGNKWIMLPIAMKSFNSNNQSEYGNGFIPEVSVDEGIYLYPLGDPDEPVLSAALGLISPSPGRLVVPQTRNIYGPRLGTSIDFRDRGIRNLMLDRKMPF
jgi:carboxyl-terminal processing protease